MNLVNNIKTYFLILGTVLLFGCICTNIPNSIEPVGASYDNGDRNSGFYGFATNNGIAYGILSERARDRYNELIKVYGKNFSPPLYKDYGITNNKTNYLITLEGLSNFSTMNRLRKSEQP